MKPSNVCWKDLETKGNWHKMIKFGHYIANHWILMWGMTPVGSQAKHHIIYTGENICGLKVSTVMFSTGKPCSSTYTDGRKGNRIHGFYPVKYPLDRKSTKNYF
jgi:hypothetical protein